MDTWLDLSDQLPPLYDGDNTSSLAILLGEANEIMEVGHLAQLGAPLPFLSFLLPCIEHLSHFPGEMDREWTSSGCG